MAKNYFVIVHEKNGEMLVDFGRLPIFWMRKVANDQVKNHPGYIVKPINIEKFKTLLKNVK